MDPLHFYQGPLVVGLSHFLYHGPAGAIEVLTQVPVSWNGIDIAILCHPNPLSEGTMHNKVVTTLAKSFASEDCATVRFQFRGVGLSEGEHGGGFAEQDDILALVDWLKQHYPACQLHLAGFSFGSFVSAAVAQRLPDLRSLISVAPAVTMRDFSGLAGLSCPWLVIQGDVDELIPLESVLSTFKDLSQSCPALEVVQLLGAGHFFHGKLMDLNTLLVQFIHQHREPV